MTKSKLRSIILNNSLFRECFFLFGRKKINRNIIDRRIAELKDYNDNRVVVKDLIVSLTTYGERLNELQYTLYSLINQTIKPEKIIVNISYEDEKKLPNLLHLFEKFGVEFYSCENYRSYTKLIPTLIRYPTKNIITVDDDIYYPKKFLEKLWAEHLSYENQIICHMVYKITVDGDKINSYEEWVHNACIENENQSNFLMGVGGVLYPPESLYKDVNNSSLFLRLSPAADDIWFYFMSLLANTKIRQVKGPLNKLRYVNPYREYGIIDGQTLTQINVGQRKNDIQFNAIRNYYKIDEKKMVEYITGKKTSIY